MCDLWLTGYPNNRTVAAYSVVKAVSGYVLKEAKPLVESIPNIFKSEISYDEALDFQTQLLNHKEAVQVYSVIVPSGTQPEL